MHGGPRSGNETPLEIVVDAACVVAEGALAVAKKVGGDVLRLFGAQSDAFTLPPPMSDAEVRRWNIQHGFPEDWRR